MIVTEHYMTCEDGMVLVRTYSDAGYMIENPEGIRYGEAIDPAECNRTYIETDELIEADEHEVDSETEIKAQAYDIVTGVRE